MKSDDQNKSPEGASVLNLNAFRQQKTMNEEFARGGRKPLYVSHLNGKITESPHTKRTEASDFGDRLQRIRSSLDKINQLMLELKRMSAKAEDEVSTSNKPKT